MFVVMERKGITPVVAVVLLMLVTISGSALLYEAFTAAQDQAEEFDTDLDLTTDSLRIESCWMEEGEDTQLHLSIRNEASATLNASEIPFRVEMEPLEQGSNLSVDQELVNAQDTFVATLTNDEAWTSDTRIDIITTDDTIEYRCFRLPN